jgi:hypothetical protein
MKEKDYDKILKLEGLYESYSVEELEVVAVRASGFYCDYRVRDEEELEAALRVRNWKLNSAFEWTDGNKARLLYVNGKMIACFERLKAEVVAIYESLEKRIGAKDGFVHDFVIDAKVLPSVMRRDEAGNLTDEYESDFYEVMTDEWNSDLNLNFSIYYNDNAFEHEILYLDREQNWNDDPWFKGLFDEHFISQAIHDLYDHTEWAFQDILKINYLDSRLIVEYEHEENIK